MAVQVNGHSVASVQTEAIGVTELRTSTNMYTSRLTEQLNMSYPTTIEDTVQRGPIYLVGRDLTTFWKLKQLAPLLILPLRTKKSSDELYMGGRSRFPNTVISIASIIQAALIAFALPMLIFLPGAFGVLTLVIGTAFVHLLFWPIQGPAVVASQPPLPSEVQAKFASERWMFLNGCCVGGYGLQQNLNQLSRTFGRPVLGVHNCTFGILGDLIECILQRALDYYSQETWAAYRYVEACCKEPSVSKVVLIAHSQGGIMASQIIDRLLITLSDDLVGKLEVYTFGNAALRFNNPIRSQAPSTSRTSSLPIPRVLTDTSDVHSAAPRVIKHIEHYCNSSDMVTRWGALYALDNIVSNRFCGKVFISERTTGHMLNQHYLNKMFPIDEEDILVSGVPFLDRHVNLDAKKMLERKQDASNREQKQRADTMSVSAFGSGLLGLVQDISSESEHELGLRGNMTMAEMLVQSPISADGSVNTAIVFGDGEKIKEHDLRDKGIFSIEPDANYDHHSKDGGNILPEGTTVRDSSRLWKYLNGGVPTG